MTKTLTFKRVVRAPAAEVARLFTFSTHLREWLSDVALATPHKGGRLYLGWNSGYYASGEYTAVTPSRIAFTWRGRGYPAATRVQVGLKEKNGATTVTVTHSGIGAGQAWGRIPADIARGWEASLENLQSVMETGHDLRFTLRPMLGVMVEAELDAERAKKYGVPVDHGVRLSGVVDGMGAQAAGLRGGDVIVSIGGKKVASSPSLFAALQGRRAGQTVPVTFYRGRDRRTVPMTLSARPLPEVPATAAELAEYVRGLYAGYDAQLAECFAGVSEAEANYRPAPDEWSAKEVVSHLLQGERDGLSYLAELQLGNERSYDGPFENSTLQVRVVADSYPSVAAMLADYRLAEAQTVALLAGLPPEFVARRSTFWRMAYSYTQAAPHFDEHIQQIKNALAAARR